MDILLPARIKKIILNPAIVLDIDLIHKYS